MNITALDELVVEQGKPFKWWIAVQYPDGEIADLIADGHPNARFVVVPDYGEQPVIDVTHLDYIHIGRTFDSAEGEADRMQWSGYVEIPASVTDALEPWGRGIYELTVDNGAGDYVCVDRGVAVLERKVAP